MTVIGAVHIPNRAPWVTQAACNHHPDVHPDAWHPTPQAHADRIDAKRICRHHCPVRAECLNHAIQHGETDGIWGGMTPGERQYHQRKNRKEAAW